MNIQQFREEVRSEFGANLEFATPAHMRKFLCRIYAALGDLRPDRSPFVVDEETPKNYEQVVTDFFARVLDLPPDQAMILLWLFASELFYSRLGEQYAQELPDLPTFEISE